MNSTLQHHNALMAKYGVGLFPLPTYRSVSQGDWHITTHLPSLGNGYITSSAIEARAVLKRGRKVWMSIGLLEQESHSWHVHAANGIVVTAGVGMGMYAYAAAMKPSVDLVIASDVSADVIEIMKKSTNFDAWPCRNKVIIIESDVLSSEFAPQVLHHTKGRSIDYLYADIWPNFPAEEAPRQTAEMLRNLKPRAAGWWGQELSFAQYCQRTERAPDEASLNDYFTEISIPAPIFTAGYLSLCQDLIAAYDMGPKKKIWDRVMKYFSNQTNNTK
jgi:hypothetical protein